VLKNTATHLLGSRRALLRRLLGGRRALLRGLLGLRRLGRLGLGLGLLLRGQVRVHALQALLGHLRLLRRDRLGGLEALGRGGLLLRRLLGDLLAGSLGRLGGTGGFVGLLLLDKLGLLRGTLGGLGGGGLARLRVVNTLQLLKYGSC
jgi:hypothetical protein